MCDFLAVVVATAFVFLPRPHLNMVVPSNPCTYATHPFAPGEKKPAGEYIWNIFLGAAAVAVVATQPV